MAQKSNFIVRGGLDVSEITKGLNKTQTQITKFQSGIGKAVKGIAIALGGLAIGSYIKDSVSDAMSVESSVNQLNRIMGNSAGEFNKWAQTQASAFGIAKTEAYKYGATFGNLISGFVSGTTETEKYTEQLMKASAVTASATGRTMEDTMERIRSGLLGNTESIEDLGINVNVALLQTTNAFKQIAGNRGWNDLTFQEQQQIRLMAILEQSNIKYGDSLAGTTATKQMNFLATLKNIKLNIGQAFLPIYNIVLPVLNALASKLEYVTSVFAQFMQAVFGKTITTTKAIENQTSATSNLADSTDAVGNSAEKTAKKVNKSVASFDQINQIPDNSTDGSDSGSSGSGAGGTGGVTTTDTNAIADGVTKVSPQVQKLIDKFNDLKKAIEPTTTALKNLWNEGLSKLGGFVLGGLKSLWSDFLKPIGTWVLGENGLPKLIKCLNSILKDINWDKLNYAFSELLKAVTPLGIAMGQGFIDFITDVGEQLKPAIVELLSLLADAIIAIARALKKVDPKTMEEFGRLLGAIYISNTTVTMLEKLGVALGKLAKPLKTLKELGGGSILVGLGKGLMSIDPVSTSIILGDLVTNLDESLAKLTTDKFGKFWTEFLGILTTAGIGVAAGFAFGGLPGAIIGGIIGALAGFITTDMFSQFWKDFKQGLSDSMKTIFNFDVTKQLFDDMAYCFEQAFNSRSFLDIGKYVLLGIMEGFVGAMSFITEPITDFFNGVYKAICNLFGIHSPATSMMPIGKFILLGIRDGFVNTYSQFKTILSGFKDKCIEWLGDMKTKFVTKGKDIINGIKNGVTDNWENFKGFVGGLPEKISTSFGNIKTLFTTKGSALISGIKQGWNDGWIDFKTWLSNIPSKIASGIGSLVSVGKNLVKGFITGLKSIHIPKLNVDIGSTTKSIFGKKIDIPKLNVSWNAKGGIFNKPSVIGVGEAGKEAVMPLENNTGWIDNLAGQITTKMGSGNGLTESQLVNAFTKALKATSSNTILKVGNEELARATNKGQATLNRRTQLVTA